MPLDPNKLRRDVEARRAERGQGFGSGGRSRTGAMASIRQHLAEIEALRSDGATWPDIAAALTAQGIVRGDGGPLTGRHLTALIASIRRQDAGRAAAQSRRAVRADVRHAPTVTSMAEVPRGESPISGAEAVSPTQGRAQGSPDALFQRLDQKAQQAAHAAAERPDFSKGLIKSDNLQS